MIQVWIRKISLIFIGKYNDNSHKIIWYFSFYFNLSFSWSDRLASKQIKLQHIELTVCTELLSLVKGGAKVKIGGTSCTSWTIITIFKPAIFLVSFPGSV